MLGRIPRNDDIRLVFDHASQRAHKDNSGKKRKENIEIPAFAYFSEAINILDIIGSTGNSAMRRPS